MYKSLLAAVLCVVVCMYCYGVGRHLLSPSHPTVDMQEWMGGGGGAIVTYLTHYLTIS